MRSRVLLAAACALTFGVFVSPANAASPSPSTSPSPSATATPSPSATPSAPSTVDTRPACGAAPAAGHEECLALVRTTAGGAMISKQTATVSAPPVGYSPADLRSAYELAAAAATSGGGQTVALVDAFDDPSAEADLGVYRAQYGLPACTTANGCFRKVNQEGAATPLPTGDQGWAIEESLDLDMVSAVCPLCHILLVESDDNQDYNLAASVATAAKLGATQISNSYGEPEYPGEISLEKDYNQPGAEVTAAAGDGGYGVSYPAASQYVTAVGGTSLWPSAGSRGWAESVWTGSGSGCSTVIPKPSWQHDVCTHRTNNDVSAVADPATPVAVYDSDGAQGWVEVGGTSVGSPIIASVYALLGDDGHDPGGSYFYSHQQDLFPVTSGANGSCTPAYLCTAENGYSGPIGLGTPDFTGVSVTGASCVSGWSSAPSQPIPDQNSLVDGTEPDTADNAVAVLSPRNVWTAGTYLDNQQAHTAINSGYLSTLEHWDGSRWTVYPSQDFTDGDPLGSVATFNGLSFDSPDDGWAVGAYGFSSLSDSGAAVGAPMAAHWDGHTWTPSPVLDPVRTAAIGGDVEADAATAVAVAAISPDDVWLAGEYLAGSGEDGDGSFLEHWNGSTWSAVSFPGDSTTVLTSIYASSASDIWAVGNDSDGPQAVHWNGSQWQSSELAGSPDGTVRAYNVSGSSADDVWVAGRVYLGYIDGVPTDVPFTEHWDGHAWTGVPLANASLYEGADTEFFSVSATSATNAWAVGQWMGMRGAVSEDSNYLLAHWDGHTWTVLPEPQTAVPNGLNEIAASTSGDLWISGGQKTSLPGQGPGLTSPFLLRYGCGTS